jgi:hypothetical protein
LSISEGVNLKPTSKEESKVLKKSKVLIQPNAFSIFLSKSAFFSLTKLANLKKISTDKKSYLDQIKKLIEKLEKDNYITLENEISETTN